MGGTGSKPTSVFEWPETPWSINIVLKSPLAMALNGGGDGGKKDWKNGKERIEHNLLTSLSVVYFNRSRST